MLSNVISAGKDIANKIGNKLLNLSEIEAKIKEATNDEQWGPQGFLMKEIAEETFSSMNFNEVMTFLWYRIFSERPINGRRTYKGLVLLSYILINGSDYVTIRCKDHIDDINRLGNFCDSNGTPDTAIRKKARDVCDLLTNTQRLETERDKAKSIQTRYYSQQTSSPNASFDGDRSHSTTTNLDDFDSWQPKSKSIPLVIGESFINFVNTFTQNISGPPPTETHDNFDLPTYYDTEKHVKVTEDIQSSTIDKSIGPRSINKDHKDVDNVQMRSVELVKKVDDEVPIIDFSEPLSIVDCRSKDFVLDFSKSNTVVQEDDFGDFRGWSSNGNQVPEKSTVNQQSNDFFSDFDTLVCTATKVGNIDKIDRKDNNNNNNGVTQVTQDKPKSEGKLGSTWDDIGSLKIDLDNVVGGRRPMYSKS